MDDCNLNKMSNAKRDNNRITVGLAYDETNTQPLKVDASTGTLIVEITPVASLPATSSPAIKRDSNDIPVVLAVTDDANSTPSPLLTDSNGLLIVDVLIE